MNILYEYQNKELTKFLTNPFLVRDELYQHGIVLCEMQCTNFTEAMGNVIKERNYMSYSLHNIYTPQVKLNLHYHEYNEDKLIIKGSGMYYFDIDDKRIELHVSEGDFISIPAKAKHYFNTVDEMVMVNFASSNDSKEFLELV